MRHMHMIRQFSSLTIFGITLSLGLFFLSTHSALAAGQVFYDGSEAGNTNLWSQVDGRDRCLSVTSGVGGASPFAGSRMIECNWNGLVAGGDNDSQLTLGIPNIDFNSEFLIRTKIRCGSDKDNGAFGAKWMRIGDFNAGGDMTAFVFNESNGNVMSFWGTSGELENATDYGSDWCSDVSWHAFEIYVRKHASTGQVKVWIDDALEYDRSGDTTQSTGLWKFHMMSNWSSNPGWEHDANNHMYWDEFEVYSDTGTGGTGSLSAGTMTQGTSDTAPPAAPTGLGVQ